MRLTYDNYRSLSAGMKEAVQIARDNYCINKFLFERALLLMCALEKELKKHDDYFNLKT